MDEGDAPARLAVDKAERVSLRDPELALSMLADLDLAELRTRDTAVAARVGYTQARLLSTVRGAHDEALGAIRAARRDWLASGNVLDALATDLGRASVLHDIGDHDQAVRVSEALLSRLTAAAVPPEREDDATSVRARAHHNLGNARSALGDYDAALRDYDLAANLYSAIGWRRLQAETDANRGLTYLRLGMAHRALAELSTAVRALRAEGHELGALRTEVDLAEAYLSLDDAPSALWLLEVARTHLEELNAAPDLGRLSVVVAQGLADLGMSAESHQEATAAYKLFTDLTMVSESARAITVAACASRMLGDTGRAVSEIQLAISLFSDSGNRPGEAAARLVLAQMEADRGRTHRAVELLRSATADLEEMRDNVNACNGHLLLAELPASAEEARRHLDRAVELVQSLDVPALRARLALGRARHDRRQGDLVEAAARLRAALLRTARTHRPPLPANELETVRGGARQEALAELLDVLLAEGTNAGAVAAWRWANWSRARVAPELDQAGRPVRWHQPEDLPVLNGPVLQYHVLGADVVAFVVRDAQVHVRRLRGAVDATRLHLGRWEAACALRRLGGGRGAEAPADGHHPALEALHALLVAPVADLLEDDPAAPLLVVAHRHLFGVPFEALHDGGPPFGMTHRLTLTSALTPCSARNDDRPPAGNESTLVLAVPDDRAPGILHDAMLVTALRPEAEVYVGTRATSAVLRERGAVHDIVHIASHADFDPERAAESVLQLADGALSGRELHGLDLGGTLVFLASCEGGRSSDGIAGPDGLAWSLLAAGSRTVLAATWSVEDAATSAFVRHFYSHVAAGRRFHAAAHAARADLAQEYPDPYHWAAFRVISAPSSALHDGLDP
ncbi:MAG: CHAT domain-containing protein [Marmoricola sp.]